MKIIRKTIDMLRRFRSERNLVKEFERLERKLDGLAKDLPELTSETYNQINKFWYPYIKHNIGNNFYRIMSNFTPPYLLYQYVNEQVILPFIITKLNPPHYAKSLANKGLYQLLFAGVNRPKEIVRNCAGCIYDDNNSVISLDDAVRVICEEPSTVVVKASTDTYGGYDVKVINSKTEDDIYNTLTQFKKDYVVQTFVKQSKQTEIFNPTSLNTFRVTSLLLNGKFSVSSVCMRCGGIGATVDNASSGGVMVGVDELGNFLNAVTYKKLGITASENGLNFKDYKLQHIDKVIEFVKQLHYLVPYCAFIGWDVCLDENDNPMLIESNMSCPGIIFEQICVGKPVFGDRLQEVLDYCFPKN